MTDTTKQPRCDECRFHGPRYAIETVECRRYPPPISSHTATKDPWPGVPIDGWCGEFQPRDQQ